MTQLHQSVSIDLTFSVREEHLLSRLYALFRCVMGETGLPPTILYIVSAHTHFCCVIRPTSRSQ